MSATLERARSTGTSTETPPPPLGRTARRDAAVRTGAGVALWLSLLLVGYWWSVDGGIRALGGWQSGLTSTGQVTGLVASVLLLAQVLLMARLPLLERAFGQDRLARVHRVVGFTSFNLMLAHIVLITWGYAAGSLARTPSTLWQLLTQYPGVLLATGGTLALVMVVLTSVKAARRRVRYESWHLLHLYAYLGVGLALPHQLWTGQDFTASPGRTLFWWTAWAVAAGAVLIWRIGVPLRLNLRHRLRVTSVVPESSDVVSVYVTGRHLHRLDVRAGQFLSWRFLAGRGWSRTHPYSLSAAPDGRSLRISVETLGDGSSALRRLRPGTRALVEGPYGRLSTRARTRPKVAMIGAGVGITPLRSLAEEMQHAPGDAVLLHRFATEPLFTHEFTALSAEKGLDVLYLPGHRRAADSWLGDGIGAASDLAALTYWVPDIADRDVYVCGPTAWTDLVCATLTAAGLPEERLHLETFVW